MALLAQHTPHSSLSQSSRSPSYPAGEASSVRTSLTLDSGSPLLPCNNVTTLTGLENFEAWFMSLEAALRPTECWNIWRRREINDLEFIAASRSRRAKYKRRQPTIAKAEVFHIRLRMIIDLILGTIDPGVRRYINEPKIASFWTVDNVHDIIIDLFFLLLLEDAIARGPAGEMAQFSASFALSALSQHTTVGCAMPLDDVMAQMQDLEEGVPNSLKRLVRRRKADLSKRMEKAKTLMS
ncbi:hypothetical protein CLAFUW4_07333 [Fulvia fulva]|uniref:Uncharacterized protein n=1 Tax=Passalora fulva TaxID=5499 RepID=A0A9Q8LJI3_PASFU|nr:uncharacterized protein CLAFUR5_07462 [Fulvia fulva]KAK4621565.1 hypothetical protein CLAFUR4_07340 [Fulvia fulva]KAK4622380.1 hypothetical protein CLAFUR0_07338 [Fulvia fulva]UJO18552.1 hypothetical protein CLAFUR5_07462 [Fulvia fulva]WPV15867.1 hypothetical protein CLAFUW4_07333 [Fulvia fulva]WPV31188.1 hypothetical protein CLAFUW7_07334 [Fulvia fulva]